jgi:hypothetical protein
VWTLRGYQGAAVEAVGLYEGDPHRSLLVTMPNGDRFVLGVDALVRFVEEAPGRWVPSETYDLPWRKEND